MELNPIEVIIITVMHILTGISLIIVAITLEFEDNKNSEIELTNLQNDDPNILGADYEDSYMV